MIVPALARRLPARRAASAARTRIRQLARRRRGDGRRQRRVAARRHALARLEAVHRRQHGRLDLEPDPRLQRLRPPHRRRAAAGGGGIGFGGAPGLWRMFNEQVGGQIAWLIPLAAIGLVAGPVADAPRRRAPTCAARRCVLFGVWALVHVAVFCSQQGIFHPYYVSALAPGRRRARRRRDRHARRLGAALVGRPGRARRGDRAHRLAGGRCCSPARRASRRRCRIVIPVAAARGHRRLGPAAHRRARRRRATLAVAAVAAAVALVAGPGVLQRRQRRARAQRQQRARRAGRRASGFGLGVGRGAAPGGGERSPPAALRARPRERRRRLTARRADRRSRSAVAQWRGPRRRRRLALEHGDRLPRGPSGLGHVPARRVGLADDRADHHRDRQGGRHDRRLQRQRPCTDGDPAREAGRRRRAQVRAALQHGGGGPGGGGSTQAITSWVKAHGTVVTAVTVSGGTLYRVG